MIDDVSIQKLPSRDIKDTSMFTDPHEVPINGLENGMFWETHYLTGGTMLPPNGRKKVTKALSHYDSNHHKSSMYGTFTPSLLHLLDMLHAASSKRHIGDDSRSVFATVTPHLSRRGPGVTF